jgi:capsular polysaccharide biosynthesis protein
VDRVLQILLRRVGMIMLVPIVATGSALGFSLAQTPTYQASAKILVAERNTKDTSAPSFVGNVSDLQDLTLTVAEGAETMPVAQAAVEQMNVAQQSAGDVLQNMSAEAGPGTMYVNISYMSSDPKEAQLTANAIGQALSEKVSGGSLGANGIIATVWAPAMLPQNPVSPDLVRNVTIAFVLGSVLGVALAFLLEHMKGFSRLIDETRNAGTDSYDRDY